MVAVLNLSRQEALRLKSDKVTPAHLLLGILRQGSPLVVGALEEHKANIEILRQTLENDLTHNSPPSAAVCSTGQVELSDNADRIIKMSVLEAVSANSETV